MLKNILIIVGSASKDSSNLKLIEKIKSTTKDQFVITVFDRLRDLPHFDPTLSITNTPEIILGLRQMILNADGLIICTPEYIFSIPSGLKNAIEWCVSTTVFSKKPVGLITASASGLKGHEELKLIMKTVDTVFTNDTTLLIRGIKGKIDQEGNITDAKTEKALNDFIKAFAGLVINAC